MLLDDQNQRMARARIRDAAVFELFAFTTVLAMSMVIDAAFAQLGVLIALGISLHRYRLSSRSEAV